MEIAQTIDNALEEYYSEKGQPVPLWRMKKNPDWLGVDGYEKLFFDAIHNDQSHFVHSDEVTESWRIVDDLLCIGDKCPVRTTPYIYKEGSWGPEHKTKSITNWDYPAQPMDKDEKREFYKGLRERIKQLRMEHLFEEPCPLYEEEDDDS